MWKCDNCRSEFDRPRELNTTYENYYGVASLFGDSRPMTLAVCPYCEDENIEEVEEVESD